MICFAASLGFTSSNHYLSITSNIHCMAKPTQHQLLGPQQTRALCICKGFARYCKMKVCC